MRKAVATLLACAALVAGLSGCNAPDKLVFITKSSFSLEASNKPPAASLGYDRFEGYVGPRILGEEPPSVAAKFSSSGGFFSPAIRQFYAIGGAADEITGATTSQDPSIKALIEGRKTHCPETTDADFKAERKARIDADKPVRTPVVAATSTSVGLRLGATTTVVDDIMLGFRRKEGTFIRFIEDDRCVPSVLAVFDLNVSAIRSEFSPDKKENAFGQFFATGKAARKLAQSMKKEFDKVDWEPPK
jgi:hypothetical protein